MPEFNSNETKTSIPQKMVDWLFREHDLSLEFSEWVKLLSAMFIVSNSQFSQDFFDVLSKKIATSFVDPHLSDLKKDFILYNALSYIAFADPHEGRIITIKGIDYSIQKLALTSGWISSTYYAYGLKAVTDKNAQSLLLFQSTTMPSDHGFLAGILADTRPHGAVGTQLYVRGQEKIQDWISSEYKRTKKRIMCTGQSLGGAMSLHAYIHQPDAVDYFIINPPALTHREKRIYEKRQLELSLNESSKTLMVALHINDPVWSLGTCYLPPGTKIYRHGKKNESKIVAHAKTPDCRKEAPELCCIEHDNNRVVNSYFWKIIKPFLFVAVLVLHALALPVRIIIKITQELSKSHHNNKLEIPDDYKNSANLYEIVNKENQSESSLPYKKLHSVDKSNYFFTQRAEFDEESNYIGPTLVKASPNL